MKAKKDYSEKEELIGSRFVVEGHTEYNMRGFNVYISDYLVRAIDVWSSMKKTKSLSIIRSVCISKNKPQ